MYFLFRSPKSRVVVLSSNGVLRSVTKVMVVPNSNLWNISVMRSSVTKSHCRIRARMANIGRSLSPNRLNAGQSSKIGLGLFLVFFRRTYSYSNVNSHMITGWEFHDFIDFMSLRFYMKLILEILEVQQSQPF